jgi:protein-S-isoprenylcysteine O-methyltransferase Ste14
MEKRLLKKYPAYKEYSEKTNVLLPFKKNTK